MPGEPVRAKEWRLVTCRDWRRRRHQTRDEAVLPSPTAAASRRVWLSDVPTSKAACFCPALFPAGPPQTRVLQKACPPGRVVPSIPSAREPHKSLRLSLLRFLNTTAGSPRRNSSHRKLGGPRSAARHSDARTLPATRSISGGPARSPCTSCRTRRPSRASTRNASRLQHLQESRSVEWISINHRLRPSREAEPGRWPKVSALCPFHESVLPRFRCLPRYLRRKRPRRSQDTLRSFR